MSQLTLRTFNLYFCSKNRLNWGHVVVDEEFLCTTVFGIPLKFTVGKSIWLKNVLMITWAIRHALAPLFSTLITSTSHGAIPNINERYYQAQFLTDLNITDNIFADMIIHDKAPRIKLMSVIIDNYVRWDNRYSVVVKQGIIEVISLRKLNIIITGNRAIHDNPGRYTACISYIRPM